MEIRISGIKENPFRKELGVYNEEQIAKIVESFKMSDFGKDQRFDVRATKDGYELVFGHHRLEALKRYHGTDIEVEIIIRNYNDKQMLVELLRENLTRDHDWFLRMRSLVLAKQYLLKEEKKKDITPTEIIKFLSIDNILVKKDEAYSLLRLAEKLAPDLLTKTKKTMGLASKDRDEDILTLDQAEMLSVFDEHAEQRDLARALKNSVAQRTRDQGKLISLYRSARKEVKEKIRSGDTDLASLLTYPKSSREERKKDARMLDEGKKLFSSNQKALYVFTCLDDALKNLDKIERKKLSTPARRALKQIFRKTIDTLTEALERMEDEDE